MPIGGLRKDGLENTSLVFDAWANVDGGELLVEWDVALSTDERALAASLVERLGYLGRSESWVDARMAAMGVPLRHGSAVLPCDRAARPGPEFEQIALLAPETPEAYLAWRAAQPAADPPSKGRRAPKGTIQRRRGAPPLPLDLLSCLQMDSASLQAEGWSQPPGSRRVLYWRSADALEVGAPPLRRTVRRPEPVHYALIALAVPSGNPHVLPNVTRTVPQAERLHRALVAEVVRDGGGSPCIIGRGDDRRPLTGHRHAHLMPLDVDADGHIDHVAVWAPMALDAVAQRAIRSIRRTFAKGVGELHVALAGFFDLDDLGSRPAGIAGDIAWSLAGAMGGSTEWISATPFVLPRHLKERGKNTLDGQVIAELAARGLPVPMEIAAIDPRHPSVARMRHFVVQRDGGPPPPRAIGIPIRLKFSQPVRGPIALGYGSHFGLGRFEPLTHR